MPLKKVETTKYCFKFYLKLNFFFSNYIFPLYPLDIIYSMGNFCYGGSRRPENRSILYQIEWTISNDGVLEGKTSEIIPCYVYTGDVNNYQPTPIEDEVVKQKVLDFMSWKVNSPL